MENYNKTACAFKKICESAPMHGLYNILYSRIVI